MTSWAPRHLLVISLEPLDASTELFFGHLAQRLPETVRVIRYGHPDLAAAMAGASVVVLVRGLFEFGSIIPAARALGIPLYYFIDDNFMLLREQPGVWSALIERYSIESVRDRLGAFRGVMLSSVALIEYFGSERLHDRLVFFPPIEWRQVLSPSPTREGASIAFFGGRHLHDILLSCVVPAVRRLATEQPVTLIAAGVDQPIAPSPGLTVVYLPYDLSYARALRRLADAGVDVLVHPSAAGLRNNSYKNPHALISAHALGAVPIVSDRPPYDALRSADVTFLCSDSVESWYSALVQAIQPEHRSRIHQRLSAFCASHFGGSLNRQVVEELLREHNSPDPRWAFARRGFIRARMLVGRAAVGVSRRILPRARIGGV